MNEMCSSRLEYWNGPASKPNCLHGEQTMRCNPHNEASGFFWNFNQAVKMPNPASSVGGFSGQSHSARHSTRNPHPALSNSLPWAVRELFTEEHPAEQKSARHHSQRCCCTLGFRIIHYLSEMPLQYGKIFPGEELASKSRFNIGHRMTVKTPACKSWQFPFILNIKKVQHKAHGSLNHLHKTSTF